MFVIVMAVMTAIMLPTLPLPLTFTLADECGLKDAVKTDCINVRQETIKDANGESLEWVVTKDVVITVHDVDSFDKIFAGAIALGVTVVHNVEFKAANLQEIIENAKNAAIEDARKKAEWQAKQLGKKIIGVQSVTEGSTHIVDWYTERNRWANQTYVEILNSKIKGFAEDTGVAPSVAAQSAPRAHGYDSIVTTPAVEGPSVQYAFGPIAVTSNIEVTFIIGE
jgi:hypothetical protein